MKMEKTKNTASEVIKDLEHTNLATFSLNETELINIDGEDFFAKGLVCYSLEIILNGRKVILNDYNKTPLKQIQVNDLWVFYNTRKVLFYDNAHQELLGEVTKIVDPRNQRERIKDLSFGGV